MGKGQGLLDSVRFPPLKISEEILYELSLNKLRKCLESSPYHKVSLCLLHTHTKRKVGKLKLILIIEFIILLLRINFA